MDRCENDVGSAISNRSVNIAGQPLVAEFVYICKAWLFEMEAADGYTVLNSRKSMSILEVKGLAKCYPGFCLSDVSFSLEKGRITGFIGRNGAGKTTLIKAVLNLVHPDGGEILYRGRPVSGNEAFFKMHTGYSTGTLSWYPKTKIREIASVVRSFYDGWSDGAYRKYLALFDIDEDKRASELSAGMKVKCNLLFALSHSTDILILDEPTSALDPFSRDELLSVFRKLADEGRAVFFSTHIISDIEKAADDIVYISKGRIIASGTKEDFMLRCSLSGECIEETFLRFERESDRV